MNDSLQLVGADQDSALRRLLFRDELLSSPTQVVGWWERRRLLFNGAVGVVGITSVAAIYILSAIGPNSRGMGGPPLIAIIAYAVAANVLYTGGWVAELALKPWLGRSSGTVGATFFRYGLTFAVGLTAIPIVVAAAGFAFRVAGWLFGGG